MPRWLIVLGTVLFGIVPATLELLVAAFFYWSTAAGAPNGVIVVVDWVSTGVLCLTWAGFVIGYVALFFAAAARTSRWVAIGLSIGAAAMAYAIVSGASSYLSAPSAIVAMLHAGGYFVAQSRRTQTNVRAGA